jgi:hypothetical protein
MNSLIIITPKKSKKEISLKMEEADWFGLISSNVGSAAEIKTR